MLLAVVFCAGSVAMAAVETSAAAPEKAPKAAKVMKVKKMKKAKKVKTVSAAPAAEKTASAPK